MWHQFQTASTLIVEKLPRSAHQAMFLDFKVYFMESITFRLYIQLYVIYTQSCVKILYPLLPLQIHSLFLNVIQSTKYSTPLKRILSTPDPFSTPLQKVKTINVSLTD